MVSLSDETAAEQFLEKSGHVVHFEYSCGCGQSYPDDPMIGVAFEGLIEDYWKEELQVVAALNVFPSCAISPTD